MRCPFCGHEDTQVKDSRPTDDSAAIRRRRFCQACGSRFTTFERVQLRELTVIKKTGKRVPFDRDKLARSIMIATRKRPVEAERVQLRELTVIKKTGKRVPFDRDKLARSIMIATRKRPVEAERVERIINAIVRRLESSGEAEVTSDQVGEQVMDALYTLDPVAYVRFASVYRNFREVKDFEDFVGKLSVERD